MLSSHRLATANNVLHCFSLHPAKSEDWIPIKQAHSVQVPPYRSHALYRSQLPFLVNAYLTLVGCQLFSYMVYL